MFGGCTVASHTVLSGLGLAWDARAPKTLSHSRSRIIRDVQSKLTSPHSHRRHLVPPVPPAASTFLSLPPFLPCSGSLAPSPSVPSPSPSSSSSHNAIHPAVNIIVVMSLSFQSPLLTGAAASAASSSPLLLQQLPYTSRSFNLTNTNSTAYSHPSGYGNSTFAPPAPGTVDAGGSPLAWFLVSVIGADLSGDDGDEELKRWSSFIGICIAVIGNVLISLALNIQKFAHMRLARKRVLLERAPATAVEVLDPEDGSNTTMGVGATTTPTGAAVAAASLPDEVDAAGSENETTTLLGDAKKNKQKKIRPRLGSSGRKKKAAAAAGKDDMDTSYITSPLWWLGLTLMFFGECGNFLAYGFAPASIVSPLGVVALVTNCVIAPLMLKEPFRGRDVLGVLVSIAGAVTVVWSAEKEEVKVCVISGRHSSSKGLW